MCHVLREELIIFINRLFIVLFWFVCKHSSFLAWLFRFTPINKKERFVKLNVLLYREHLRGTTILTFEELAFSLLDLTHLFCFNKVSVLLLYIFFMSQVCEILNSGQ